jgi:hypothetical protein
MTIKLAALALCLLASHLAMGQAAPAEITNSDVVSMTKAGIGEHTIILAIQRGPVKFDTSPQALIALKKAGVSDQVLNAILSSPSATRSETKSSQSQPVSQGAQPSSEENARQPVQAGGSRDVCAPQPGESVVASSVRTACCENGFQSSCSNLAHFYETGTQGLPRDLSIANDLKKRACQSGVEPGDCSVKISDPTERMAFERAIALTDPTAEAATLEAFLQLYPHSAASAAVYQMLAEIKRETATNKSPPQAVSPVTIQRAPQTAAQGLTLRILQSQSVPYIQESGGGISTSCSIVGTVNTSAYVNAYGNSAYGNATTNSNQHMSCNSYDTTMRWPHVLNVMFAEGSDGNSYIIACDAAWRWSKCNPLRAGDTFNARFTPKGIEVQATNAKGKEENPTYRVLQSRSSQ